MSQILVIEPNRMLQQAISLWLFPDHEPKLTESLAQVSNPRDFDFVIVDVASLRENHGIDETGVRSILSWNLPTIWIEERGVSGTPSPSRLVIVEQPIKSTALRAAINDCLAFPAGASRRESARKREKRSQEVAMDHAREPSAATNRASDEAKVIELVEVVDEGFDAESARTKDKN